MLPLALASSRLLFIALLLICLHCATSTSTTGISYRVIPVLRWSWKLLRRTTTSAVTSQTVANLVSLINCTAENTCTSISSLWGIRARRTVQRCSLCLYRGRTTWSNAILMIMILLPWRMVERGANLLCHEIDAGKDGVDEWWHAGPDKDFEPMA